jgi:Zn-finger nucleic acid-binding protein
MMMGGVVCPSGFRTAGIDRWSAKSYQTLASRRVTMQCPVCKKEMVGENFGVNVEVCENGCKGIWFDRGELAMLDEKNEGLGAALEAALRYPRNNDGQRGQIDCPRCSIPLHTHRFARNEQVNVDECYQCGGFFLDSGELTEIRNNRMSDADVKAYVDNLATSIPEYSQAKKDLEIREQRLEAIQRFTKFLTVSYWTKKF